MTSGKLFELALLGGAGLLASAAVAEPVADGGRKFTTELTGEAEISSDKKDCARIG